MHDHTGPELKHAYIKLVDHLKAAGLKTKFQCIDNECPKDLKKLMHQEGIDFQLALPNEHQCNAVEHAVRTWKNHFIAILCGVDEHFPLKLWLYLVPQAELTLNLMHGSHINPKLSAWAQLFGNYDYNCTTIGPLGCLVQDDEMASTHDSWAPHASDAWYTGPALDSYQCFKVFMIELWNE